MFIKSDWPGEDRRVVPGVCPSTRGLAPGQAVACNCIGKCQPIIVDANDERTDEEIRHERDASRDSYRR